jgi:TonB-linked SusC/RagA family outer membrane protein
MRETGLFMRWCSPPLARASLQSCSLVAVLLLGLALVVAPLSAQTGTVNGRVVAAGTGDPIADAQVALVGTNIGTQTDENGEFVLVNVPTGRQQIRVAAIGFQVGLLELNVQVGSNTAETLELTKTVLRLDEVVVTGTAGQARRREVGNSIAQLEVADEIDPPPSMEMMLAGRAAGVNVTQGGGAAGTGGQIRLRGTVSVSQSNLPIIYIDGVRTRSEGYYRNRPVSDYTGRGANVQASPLNDINPADIERIEIIKGSAASTLYGTEASAGVIQIFTKKGRTGAPSWTFQIDQGFAQERPFGTALNPYLNLKPGDYADTTFFIPANVQYATTAEDSLLYDGTLGGGSCADLDPNQDCTWLRRGYRSKYSGSVGGGFGAMNYFISGAYQKYDGVLPNDTESKISTRGNFTFDIRDNVRVDFNTQFNRTQIENTAQGNNAHGLTLNVYRMERNYFQSNDPRRLRALLNQEITTDINRLVTGVTVNYTPWPWFTNRYTLGYDMAHQENRNLRPYGFVRYTPGRIGEDQILYQTLTSDYVGSMTYRLLPQLGGTFSFGGQSVLTNRVRTSAFGTDFAGPGVPTVSDAASYIAAEDRLKTVNAGFFFQNVFDITNKLFITTGLRVDGNSAFGKALGLQAYPKLSVSYVISDAAFWPVGLGELKLRGAAGYSGRAPDQFDAIRTWNSENSGGLPGYEPANVGNDEVGPERTRELELGFDGGFLNQRLAVEFTWYEQRTTDALFDVRQIPSLGSWNAQAANVGEIRNRGIELSAQAIILDSPDWGFDIGANIYTNKSEVLSLGDTATGQYAVPFSTQGGWVEEGFPVIAARGNMLLNPDDVAEPIIVEDTIFGPSQPTFVFNPSVTFRFPYGIQLSARGEYQGGAWFQDGASFNALSRSVRWPTCTESRGDPDVSAYALIDAGREDELTAWERSFCIPSNTNSRMFYFKKDFFKLRDITLRLPMDWALPQVRNATLTLTAQNWIRWKNDDFRIFDPEMGARDNINDQGVVSISEHIAPPAVFTASLRVNF